MYYGSDEFNNAIENTQGNALKTRLKFSDEEIIELVSSMRYYGGSNDADDLSIGNVVSAYVEVSAFTNEMLTGREFLLESGVKLSDGTYEYAPIGYFTVQTPSGDYDEVSFTAYDRMVKFEKVYNSNLTYPTDSASVLDELCTMCGVILATPITNPITITENLKGYTCREILGYIAGIHGFFACIDRFGELNLRWYSDTPIEKSLRYVWAFEKSQEQYEVEKVEVAKDSETSFTSGNGIITLHHSNPYATQEITNNLFIKLDGYTYMPAEIEMLDDIRMDPWDVISVTYYDDISYNIPCMSITHDFGGASTTVKAVGKTSSENEYRFTGPTIRYLNRMAADLLVANRVIATKVDAEYVQANAVTVDNLDAIKAEIQQAIIGDLSADFITVEVFDAEKARIDKLETNKLDADDLSAEVAKLGYATITQLNASNAKIEELQTDRITATEVKANYADIKLANVAVADIGTLFAEVGLLDRATIVNGHVTGYLDSVEVNANKITAGTLAVDRLVFRGANSIIYELNNVTGALQAVQGNTLNGEILTDRSITVDKIVANSITANEIAAGAITASELATNSVTTAKIASNAITADKIKANSITADKLNVSSLSALSANLGTVTAGVIQSSDYVADSKGMIIDIDNSRIWSISDEMVDTQYSKEYTVITSTEGNYPYFSVIGSAVVDYQEIEIANGEFRCGKITVSQSGITRSGKDLVGFIGNGIYTPKINTDLIYLNGEMYISGELHGQDLIVGDVHANTFVTTDGMDLVAKVLSMSADIDTINRNLKSEMNDMRHLGTYTAKTTAITSIISDISGYKTIVFIPYDGTLNLDSIFVPVSAFKSGIGVSLNAYALTSYHGIISVSYVSDISIKYQIREISGWSSISFRVYGMI